MVDCLRLTRQQQASQHNNKQTPASRTLCGGKTIRLQDNRRTAAV